MKNKYHIIWYGNGVFLANKSFRLSGKYVLYLRQMYDNAGNRDKSYWTDAVSYKGEQYICWILNNFINAKQKVFIEKCYTRNICVHMSIISIISIIWKICEKLRQHNIKSLGLTFRNEIHNLIYVFEALLLIKLTVLYTWFFAGNHP